MIYRLQYLLRYTNPEPSSHSSSSSSSSSSTAPLDTTSPLITNSIFDWEAFKRREPLELWDELTAQRLGIERDQYSAYKKSVLGTDKGKELEDFEIAYKEACRIILGNDIQHMTFSLKLPPWELDLANKRMGYTVDRYIEVKNSGFGLNEYKQYMDAVTKKLKVIWVLNEVNRMNLLKKSDNVDQLKRTDPWNEQGFQNKYTMSIRDFFNIMWSDEMPLVERMNACLAMEQDRQEWMQKYPNWKPSQ